VPTFSTFNRADGYVPSTDTMSRSNGSSREDRLKRRAGRCQPMEGKYPLADSFRAKEPGTEPATVQRFEGWAIYGLDSHLRTIESGTTMGEPVHGRGPGKRLLGMP